MSCPNCSCENCEHYYNQFCPFCGHHLKYHRDGKCYQPTCNCKMKPLVKWREVEIIKEELSSEKDGDGK